MGEDGRIIGLVVAFMLGCGVAFLACPAALNAATTPEAKCMTRYWPVASEHVVCPAENRLEIRNDGSAVCWCPTEVTHARE